MLAFTWNFRTSANKGLGRVVIDGVGMHRVDNAKVVRHLGKVRQQFAHPVATFATLLKLEHRRRHQLSLAPSHGRDPLPHANAFGKRLLEQLFQLRFVIKQIDLTWCPRHEKENDMLGLWSNLAGGSCHAILWQQRGQSCGP